MPIYHRVKMGETLASIAKQYGLKPYQLMNYNPQAKFISAGMSLAIPTPEPKPGGKGGGGAKYTQPGVNPGFANWNQQAANWLSNTWQKFITGSSLENPVQRNLAAATVNRQWNQIANPPITRTHPNIMGNVSVAQPGPQMKQRAAQTVQQGVYQPTGWNAIVNQPSPATQVSGQDLSGLSEKELNEYEGYLKWVMNNPERYARYQEAGYDMSYEAYLNSKYSGGGGDFWEYMQKQQMGQHKSVKRIKPKPAGQVGMGYKAYLKKIHGRNTTQTYEEVGVPQQYYNNYYSGYNNYYSPTSFGVVTWRGW